MSDDTEPVDTDSDGLSDWEEENVYGSDSDNPDSDSDGMDDGDEATAGTDTLSSTSYLFLGFSTITDSNISLSWPGVTGRTYHVEWNTNPLIDTWITAETCGPTGPDQHPEPLHLGLGMLLPYCRGKYALCARVKSITDFISLFMRSWMKCVNRYIKYEFASILSRPWKINCAPTLSGSNGWKKQSPRFQAMEESCTTFPMFGKIMCFGFQALENV